MERYFDVLLADQSFAADSEAMAVAYVQFDRARARAELGQFSELRVLELEAIYQKYLHRRTASQIAQQQTRALLAVSLGDIGELPRDLAAPSLPPLPETLPEFDELRAKASAEFERHGALVQAGPARIVRERDQQLMELLLRLELLDAAWRRVGAESARNDLKLDQSRTLYEQEVTADLGYSMSQQTRSRFDEQRIDYCRALAWAEIQALVGEPVWISANEGP
ncbi:Outer membrane efflux protein [Imhoffiella purpurea]|uniref:Outer membrane efflux protein n=2 Tax=Imhoffiella purpurea TaxID=1249627 RepID=W9VSX5_9GAMM|nr:Outer membrane efflux protein [Imhoffiella purpurea]